MRWCSFVTADDPRPRLGRGAGDADGGPDLTGGVLDVAVWARAQGGAVPAGVVDLVDLVEAPPDVQERTAALAGAAGADAPGWLAADQARLLAPLRAPNSLRDFLAFRDHVERGAARRGAAVPEAWDRIPVFYKGNRRSILGPHDEAPWPSYTRRLDYECEVAAVLGRGGRDLGPDQAAAAVFGYTIMNDWSARDIQRDEMACWLGPAKAKDFATTLGPWLVTADAWSPEEAHAMTVTVDGELWSSGSTLGRRWTFAEMVAWASRDEDLYATDVLGSGTFGGGCGLDLDRWLAPGATVTLAVEGLGRLTSRVGRAASAAAAPSP